MVEYLAILLSFLVLTIILKLAFRLQLYKSRKHLLLMNAAFFIIAAAWDLFATWRGHWAFPGTGLVGINILWIPVEEYLFFLIVPQFGLALYKIFEKYS